MSLYLPLFPTHALTGWIATMAILANCVASIVQQDTGLTNGLANEPLSFYQRERGLAFADKIRSEANGQVQTRPEPSSRADATPFSDQVAKIRAETQSYRTQIDSFERQIETINETIVEQQKLALLTLSFERDRTKVRHYLGALFAPGFTQPDPRDGVRHKVTSKKGPVSLTALREFGALDENERGLFKLGYAGSDPTNDRNRRSFPKHVGGSLETKEVEILKPAQELLIKYQKLLVDEGLLAP